MLTVVALLATATPAPVDAADALARVAAGHLDDAIARLAAGDPRRGRFRAVAAELGAGSAPCVAVAHVYGDGWSTHADRDEIIAVLAGQDVRFRGQLSALSHAAVADDDVDVDGPRWTAADARASLHAVLPAGAVDDGVRGDTLKVKLRITKTELGFVFPELESVSLRRYDVRYEVHLEAHDPAHAADLVGGPYVVRGMSPEYAWSAVRKGFDPVTLLVDDFLNRTERAPECRVAAPVVQRETPIAL